MPEPFRLSSKSCLPNYILRALIKGCLKIKISVSYDIDYKPFYMDCITCKKHDLALDIASLAVLTRNEMLS